MSRFVVVVLFIAMGMCFHVSLQCLGLLESLCDPQSFILRFPKSQNREVCDAKYLKEICSDF